ncbi:MAG: class I SAM-dependent methyltransferase [Gemmatimonadales bacterium]
MTSIPESTPSEYADVETASDDYAERFSGDVGKWFLELQARTTLELLAHLPRPATVLDVGGGHAQLTPALVDAGYRVVVVGSDPSCGNRLTQWVADGRCGFEVANLQALPYADASFDAVLCFRLLPHSVGWAGLLGELCRVSRRSVVVDYPSVRSVNVISDRLFALKKRIERNTRPFMLFHPTQVRGVFEAHGFAVKVERPQFVLPMVLHRWSQSAGLGRILEAPWQRLGLTRWLGSPIIARADRVRA